MMIKKYCGIKVKMVQLQKPAIPLNEILNCFINTWISAASAIHSSRLSCNWESRMHLKSWREFLLQG